MSLLFELCQQDTKCGHDCKLDGVIWSPDDPLHARPVRPTSVDGMERGKGNRTASTWARFCKYFRRYLVRKRCEVIHCRWASSLPPKSSERS